MVALPARVARPPEPESRLLAGVDGHSLRADFWPGTQSPTPPRPLMFAHGFGQSRLSWTSAASQMAELGHPCWSLDGRGHGESAWNPEQAPYTIDQFIGDAAHVARSQAKPPIWIGASMGGLLGIAVGALNPELLHALVLVDVTPRWEEAGVNRIMDFMRAHPNGFASVDEAQTEVARYLPHRTQRAEPDRLRRMLVPMANGRLRWHWDPRLLEDIGRSGSTEMARLSDAARALKLPVLLISGGRSDVVSRQTIEEFQFLVPHAEHRVVDDATHMVVGDDNQTFTYHLADFIKRHA
ncbi:MAG: alpha/beta hydrolase [Ahniella sp.]|nr:alpha/beta hydrolase [Ahniella sp.]